MEELKTKIIAKIEKALSAEEVELLDVLNRLLGTVSADIINTKINKL